jgi:hypothetical protein
MDEDTTDKRYYDTLAEASQKSVKEKAEAYAITKGPEVIGNRMYQGTMEFTSFAVFQNTTIPIIRA